MSRTVRFGLAIVGVTIALVLLIVFTTVLRPQSVAPTATPVSQTKVTCVGGSEKSVLMQDTEIQGILRDKYGLTVDFTPMGSLAQATMSTNEIKQKGLDCLWPSSAAAETVFEAQHKSSEFEAYRSETVLTSPEVIYAGPNGTQALMKEGIVTKRGNSYYVVKMKELLLDYVLKSKHWEDFGTKNIQGPVQIGSTNPTESNSGFILYLLKLTIVATNDPYKSPNTQQAKQALSTIRSLYDAQGLQAQSSSFGFDQWLNQGGEFRAPLYAGYESQIIEKSLQYPQLKDVNVLYPEPTVYSDHPILALNKNAQHLIDAMKDQKIQQIAWKKYGFRSVQLGVTHMQDFPKLPLAETISSINVPSADVILELNNCLKDNKQC
jgi:ABC-type Fe3+ transport system substrate-binding protein